MWLRSTLVAVAIVLVVTTYASPYPADSNSIVAESDHNRNRLMGLPGFLSAHLARKRVKRTQKEDKLSGLSWQPFNSDDVITPHLKTDVPSADEEAAEVSSPSPSHRRRRRRRKRNENKRRRKRRRREILKLHDLDQDQIVFRGQRSVSESQEVGGLNHLPETFSSSEEKLLEDLEVSTVLSVTSEATALGDYDDNEPVITEPPADDDADDAMGGGSNNKKVSQQKSRDIVTKLLRIVESQALQGANCTPGTSLNLGDKVVNR